MATDGNKTTKAEWLSRLQAMTVPCKDDGRRFCRTDRLFHIAEALRTSVYELAGDNPLAKLYRHRQFDPRQPALLVSAHVDEIYDNLYVRDAGEEVHGTFDNAAPDAVLLALMVADQLPPQAIVAFTGNEEDESRGADQAVKWLAANLTLQPFPAAAVVLDVTEEASGHFDFTLENLFTGSQAKRLPGITSKGDLARLLSSVTSAAAAQVILDAECDEAWQYDEHDLTCCSLCLPCRTLGGDLHDDAGLAVRWEALFGYVEALRNLVAGLCV